MDARILIEIDDEDVNCPVLTIAVDGETTPEVNPWGQQATQVEDPFFDLPPTTCLG